MSQPPLSSSSSSSSASSNSSVSSSNSISVQNQLTVSSNLARVHGHDHNRPLPPPRLHEVVATVTTATTTTTTSTSTNTTTLSTNTGSGSIHNATTIPLTAPLTPLSTSSSLTTSTGLVRTNSRAPAPVPVHEVVRIPTSIINNDQDQLHLQTLSSRNQSAGSVVSEVTLTVPRPDGERAVNEYVETPFRQNVVTSNKKCVKLDRTKRHHHHHHHHIHHNHHHNHHHNNQSQNNAGNPATSNSSPGKINNANFTVTKQPVSFTKEPTNSIGGSPGSIAQQIQIQQIQQQQRSSLFPGTGVGTGTGNVNLGGVIIPMDEGLSIMCEYCGRCRCESCREPPPLPSRWLCDNACFCSAETALDYASCLCCVKGLFYHCGDAGNGVEADGEGAGTCADEPCSCAGSRRMARWTCLGALTLALPCLLCYWPLKGCVALCEACYARHASHGCRCDPSTAAGRHMANSNLRDSRDPEKRLLDPVTPEL